jgi:uncharacterized protein
MKKAINILFILLVLSLATTASAQKYAKPTGYVNDFAQMLTHEQGQALNAELIAFEKKTTIEISVVTVPWLNNQSVEDYTRGLATEWGVGKSGKDNGVVFLIAPKEHKFRIEIASGVRLMLTDSRADEIRDNVIIPAFKDGEMAKGIIDGTHALMKALDTSAVPKTVTPKSEPAPAGGGWTAHDTRILLYVIGGILALILLLVIIVPPISRANDRKYVLNNKDGIAAYLAKLEKMAKNPDVDDKSRQKIAKLKKEFAPIVALTETSETDWSGMRYKLATFDPRALYSVTMSMQQDIKYADSARKRGPQLMEELPGLIEAAEKKLAEGKSSTKAVKHLEKAKMQYAKAQEQRSGMTIIDWIILYEILSSVQSDISNAQSSHDYDNSEHHHSSSSSRSDDNSSRDDGYGFGSSGNFGGGGGFDGGSSGSW